MRTPPHDVAETDVLHAVRAAWEPHAVAAEHLPVGFGAHHWRVSTGGGPSLFVTLDTLGADRTLDELAATYRAAGALADRLGFVHAGRAPWVVPFARAGGAVDGLSATSWLDGTAPAELDRSATRELLTALHATPPPPGVRTWRPLVPPTFAERLRSVASASWESGPFGERARRAIVERLPAIGEWTMEYHRLARAARARSMVPTHGEPGIHNQLLVDGRPMLVDWETLLLAPQERDTRELGEGDPEMLTLFDLEWRLSEIAEYSDWFRSPHDGGPDDGIALEGLLEELDRPPGRSS